MHVLDIPPVCLLLLLTVAWVTFLSLLPTRLRIREENGWMICHLAQYLESFRLSCQVPVGVILCLIVTCACDASFAPMIFIGCKKPGSCNQH